MQTEEEKIKGQTTFSFIFLKIKALIIDLFMIYTPILYIMTYLILHGKEEFQNNQWAIFVCVFIYGIIEALFCAIASQTPGMKAQGLILQTRQKTKPSFLLAFMRFFLWLFSLGFVFGFVFPFLRKDKQSFHDFICKTQILIQKSPLSK